MHLLRQPVDFSPGVEEDDSLGDCQRLVQITQGVQFPLLETGKHKACQSNAEGTDTRDHGGTHVTQDLEAEDTGH